MTSGGSALGEFGRIDRFFRPLTAGFAGARGLADDAAVFASPPGTELVVTTDCMVAGVHFLPDDAPADIAAKLLRVNLSDLAAMGAEPLAYTLVTAFPKSIGDEWVAAFAAGLEADQRRFAFPLAGGDSVSTPGPLTLSVTAFGHVPAGEALPRGRVLGDEAAVVMVSGTPGDSGLALAHLLNGMAIGDPSHRAYLLGRLRRPEPRMAVGRGLRGLAIGCLDISDGLLADLAHMARVCGRAAEVDAARLPLSSAAAAIVAADPSRLSDVLTGGDDYELIFAVAPDRLDEVDALAASTGVPLVAIGALKPGVPGRVVALDAAGAPIPLNRLGWVHG